MEITNKSVDKVFDYKVPLNLENKIKIGKRVEVPFGTRTLVGFILEIKETSEALNLKEIKSVIDEEVILTKELLELGKYLHKTTLASLISCYQVMLPKGYKASIKNKVNSKYRKVYYLKDIDNLKISNKQQEIIDLFKDKRKLTREELKDISKARLDVLVKNNILEEKVEEIYRLNYDNVNSKVKTLTKLQEDAVNNILTTDKSISLLYGVTGSGKTEVYMELIDRYLKKGLKSIVLVPEISLTPQLIKRFEERFGNRLALLHSALSDGEKYDEYRKIVKGEVDIVIGARSAVFAPINPLGLIIIDECHSDSYKQENNPKYNAKDVAFKRCDVNNAKVVLGSATPMLEEYARGLKNVYNLVTLDKRVNGKKLPLVELIDMNKEIRNTVGHFSKPLINLISDTIDKKEQVILLLNRRGYSSFVTCSNCGESIKCPNCDITLTYHKSSNVLRCHYCGYATKYQTICPSCHQDSLKDLGVGTEKIEEEIKNIFPKAKILRMDVDTTSRKDAHKKIVDTFAKGEADILLGTQMVAKGLDFANVTLVGVINADTSLMLPDFRSNEKTFALLNQVAGRTGRGEKEGKVVFQTFNPDNYAIKRAKDNDYISFYYEEMKNRKLMKYPPYYYLVSLDISSKDSKLALIEAKKCERVCSKYLDKTIILGPTPAAFFKVQNIYHYKLILKYQYQDNIYLVLEKLVNYYATNNKVNLGVDFNPINL